MDRAEASLNEHLERGRRIDSAAAVNARLAGFGGDSREIADANGLLVGQTTRKRSTPLHLRPEFGEELLCRGKAALFGSGNAKYRAEHDEVLQRYSLAHGVSSDGTAPVTIEGDIVEFLDATRYLINASRRLPLPDNNAPTFKRPRITQFTLTAEQVTQGDVLASQRLTSTGDLLTKATYGGTLALSEQEMNWTEPSQLGLALLDLTRQLAITTDGVLASAIETAASASTPCALDAGSADFLSAVSTAAAAVYSASKRLPDLLVVDPNRWGYLNGLCDGQGRPLFPSTHNSSFNSSGENTGGVSTFSGMSVAGLQVVVDPQLSTNFWAVGCASLTEWYENMLGLVTIAAPSTLETLYAVRCWAVPNVYAEGWNQLLAA